jgi:hypothetical protein
VLTRKQAETAAAALAIRPPVTNGAMLVCPACGSASLSPTMRRHLGLIKRTPCPHCGALLRLKWGRALLAGYLLILVIGGLTPTWPGPPIDISCNLSPGLSRS